MKRTAIILAAFALLVISALSCRKHQQDPIDVVGQWELSGAELGTKSISIGDQTVSVYIEFINDGSFKLYQMIGAGRYRLFNGTWSLNNNVLTGKYSDGIVWGGQYSVKIDNGDLIMTLEPDGKDVYRDKRCSIPAAVKESAR